MILFRKIDYYAQVVLGIMAGISIPLLMLYGFLAVLYVLGCWQLISAFANTTSFLDLGMAKQICRYWKCTGLVFASLFLCYPLSFFYNPDDVQVLAAIGISASVPLACYYLFVYKIMINHYEMRKELGSIIKSKH